jgi:S1-C subfamily serine protease
MTTILTIVGGAPHSGSGFVSGHERVTTAAHVVNTQVSPKVLETTSDRFWSGQVIHLDNERDVAVLRVPGLPFRPFRIAKREAAPGAECVIRSQWGTQSARIVGTDGDFYVIRSDEEVKFGASGGALILASSGQVIGTVSARSNQDPTIGFIAKVTR